MQFSDKYFHSTLHDRLYKVQDAHTSIEKRTDADILLEKGEITYGSQLLSGCRAAGKQGGCLLPGAGHGDNGIDGISGGRAGDRGTEGPERQAHFSAGGLLSGDCRPALFCVSGS